MKNNLYDVKFGFIYLAARLAWKWINEQGASSCLKIGGKLSGTSCPGGELSGYLYPWLHALKHEVFILNFLFTN